MDPIRHPPGMTEVDVASLLYQHFCQAQLLGGFYPPKMDGFVSWENPIEMGWFGGVYTPIFGNHPNYFFDD